MRTVKFHKWMTLISATSIHLRLKEKVGSPDTPSQAFYFLFLFYIVDYITIGMYLFCKNWSKTTCKYHVMEIIYHCFIIVHNYHFLFLTLSQTSPIPTLCPPLLSPCPQPWSLIPCCSREMSKLSSPSIVLTFPFETCLFMFAEQIVSFFWGCFSRKFWEKIVCSPKLLEMNVNRKKYVIASINNMFSIAFFPYSWMKY